MKKNYTQILTRGVFKIWIQWSLYRQTT